MFVTIIFPLDPWDDWAECHLATHAVTGSSEHESCEKAKTWILDNSYELEDFYFQTFDLSA